MGAILNFLSKNLGNIVSGAASAASLGYQIKKDKQLTGAEREANAFSASQAEASRNFEAQQAEIARDWQEQQYLQYNSPAAQMRQYQEAGINPAMMYGQGFTPAPASTGIAGSSSASSVAPSGAGNMVQMLTGLADAISGIKLKNAQIGNLEAETNLRNQEFGWNPALWENQLKTGEVNRENMLAGIRKLNADIDLIYSQKKYQDISSEKVKEEINNLVKEGKNIDARTASEYIHQGVMAAQEILARAQAENISLDSFQKSWENSMIERTGIKPGSNMWQGMIEGLQGAAVRIDDALPVISSKVADWFKRPVQIVKGWFDK